LDNERGLLKGSIEIPLPVGVVGGSTGDSFSKLMFQLMGINPSEPWAKEMFVGFLASVGLAQNFAALLALTTGGMNGHFSLHDRRIVTTR
jgi:hydroxymethylglutaryl-CoA reductase